MKILSIVLGLIFSILGIAIKFLFFAIKTILTFSIFILSVGMIGSRTQSY